MKQLTLDSAIRIFADFISTAWDIVMPLMRDRDYTPTEGAIDDWLQANWEILVERKVLQVGEYLEVYGAGADFNNASSRITDISAVPTFGVEVSSCFGEIWDFLNEEYAKLHAAHFVELVSLDGKFYKRKPQFQYTLVKDNNGKDRVVSIKAITFGLALKSHSF